MEGLSEHDRAVVKSIFEFDGEVGNSNQDLDVEQSVKEDRLDQEILNIIKRAISNAETNNFDECFRLFDEAVRRAPESPSVLNDRAQALRLAGRDEEALKDLHTAVKLSGGKGRTGIQALCQRGILYRFMNKYHEARRDFEVAAKGGSDFAQAQLVALDPYAAMGNAVLQELTHKSMDN